MLCPHCATELKIADRQGVEIDYCPKCRGVWLDRGELDKILERAAVAQPGAASAGYGGAPRAPWRDDDDDDYEDRRPYEGRPGYGYGNDRRAYPRKRKSWLGDLFDFD